ncbi:MAG: divalent-cation tolerance protein CutA [Rhodospirillales bacterium]|nr:divalent-cation tolerance protein CutA [Rhodospirillales bacterium]MCB9995528.1 divalent-cation tolerance protein CutA [Rhodospirillales bacterium]
MSVIFVYVTCATQEEAGTISRALLEKQMIACANVMVPHQSLYRWEGEIKEAQETVMILKTYESLFHELKREICALHSYSCPCVVALPVKAGHEPFLEWIGAQLHQ